MVVQVEARSSLRGHKTEKKGARVHILSHHPYLPHMGSLPVGPLIGPHCRQCTRRHGGRRYVRRTIDHPTRSSPLPASATARAPVQPHALPCPPARASIVSLTPPPSLSHVEPRKASTEKPVSPIPLRCQHHRHSPPCSSQCHGRPPPRPSSPELRRRAPSLLATIQEGQRGEAARVVSGLLFLYPLLNPCARQR